ncbi:MAG: phospholipase D family protein [Armatimonadota bacterium]|nr:phospholipase D family protein [Armatimonadota bacterium]
MSVPAMVTVLATGPELVGGSIRGIEPALVELIRSAASELHIAAYRVGPGSGILMDHVERALAAGVRVICVVSSTSSVDAETAARLARLRGSYPHMTLVDLAARGTGLLHAKAVVADRRRAIVGSANLTWGGLVANLEIALLVEGDPAWQIAALIDRLATGRTP